MDDTNNDFRKLKAEDLMKNFEEAIIAKHLEVVVGITKKSKQYADLRDELERRLCSGKSLPLEDVVSDIFPELNAPIKNIRACVIAMFVRKGLLTPDELDEILRVSRYLEIEITDIN